MTERFRKEIGGRAAAILFWLNPFTLMRAFLAGMIVSGFIACLFFSWLLSY